MSRILGQFGTDIAPYVLREAAGRDGGGVRVQHGTGWALAGAAADADGGVAAVLTGRLDVRLPLLSRIEAGGRGVAERAPATLVRAAFQTEGPECTGLLRGRYAVAVADTRGAQRLVLATDDAGSIPIYHHWDRVRQVFSFASDLPALLALLPSRPALWQPGLDAYLTTGAALDGRTLFDGVRMLPPGTTAVYERGIGLRLIRRDPAVGATVPAPGTAGRELQLERARRSRGGTPADALLDLPGPGTTLLRELTGPDLPSAGPAPGEAGSDALLPLDRRWVRDLPALLPELVWRLGQPEADPGALLVSALYAAARRRGIGTVLASDAAEEVVAGRRRVEAALGEGPQDWLSCYADRLAPVPAAHRAKLYTRDYRAFLDDRGDAAHGLAARLGAEAERRSRRAALTAFELDELLPVRGLRRTAHLAGGHAVSGLLPWPARRLWTAAAPYAAGPAPTAAAGALSGLLAPGSELMDFVRETLSPSRLRISGLLSRRSVEKLFAAQLARPSERLVGTIWALVMFELWREEFGPAVRRPVPPPVRAKSPADLPALTRRAPVL
ncbi:asparagine synthase-related protein [Streptomyces sp. R44]|uniref:asparagine synthase (glutamine-hydrolyzing) n=1 Tax=Streptomyces sp. R44 TaxID=3238633 RepID=A0AB39TA43_9ACTN